MKLMTKLLFILVSFLASFSVLAGGDIYLYGDPLPSARSDTPIFNAQALNTLTQKYHMYFDPIGSSNNLFFPVSARELRYGVYVLQSTLKDGDKVDLIFKNLDAAKAFETELKNTATTDKFYAEPVGYPGTHEVIAVGYVVTYPGVPPRLKIKYHFIANPWGWQPGEHE